MKYVVVAALKLIILKTIEFQSLLRKKILQWTLPFDIVFFLKLILFYQPALIIFSFA
jgi:hypothetical protein